MKLLGHLFLIVLAVVSVTYLARPYVEPKHLTYLAAAIAGSYVAGMLHATVVGIITGRSRRKTATTADKTS